MENQKKDKGLKRKGLLGMIKTSFLPSPPVFQNTEAGRSPQVGFKKHIPEHHALQFLGVVPQIVLVTCLLSFYVFDHVVAIKDGHLDFSVLEERHTEPLVYFHCPSLIKGFYSLICKNVCS